nr:hypothetical transcript [Hymenolepis microstoma]
MSRFSMQVDKGRPNQCQSTSPIKAISMQSNSRVSETFCRPPVTSTLNLVLQSLIHYLLKQPVTDISSQILRSMVLEIVCTTFTWSTDPALDWSPPRLKPIASLCPKSCFSGISSFVIPVIDGRLTAWFNS